MSKALVKAELPKQVKSAILGCGRKQDLEINRAWQSPRAQSCCSQFDGHSFLPSSVPQNNEKLQESPCIFALTPRQVELIRNSRYSSLGINSSRKCSCIIPSFLCVPCPWKLLFSAREQDLCEDIRLLLMYTKELWEEWELQIPPSRSLSFTCAALIPLWNGAFGQERGDEIIDDLNSLLSWWCECLQPLLGPGSKGRV